MVSICIYYGEDDWDGPLKLTFSKRGYNYGIRFYTTYLQARLRKDKQTRQ